MTNSDPTLRLGIPNEEGQVAMMFSRGGPRAGAGRKRTGETRKVSLTLTDEVWTALDHQCSELDCSRSELLRRIIESSMDQER
ncbi:hypothetical protein ACFO9Q_20535 [Paenibacillus sp. GCM10023252]|uniref:hypothetical protein n=1 Tax=Paenibacillus sp. GCM10023252 TaxID=3252649 RepID=UPI003615413E